MWWAFVVACGPVAPTESGALPIVVDTGTPDTDVPPPAVVVESRATFTCAQSLPHTSYRRVGVPDAVIKDSPALLGDGGVGVGDFNGDDRLDVFVPGVQQTQVFLGDGTGALSEWADALSGPITLGTSATPVDLDGDGDLDVVVGRRGAPNVLAWNDVGGFRTQVFGPPWRTAGTAWHDTDGDGDLDGVVFNYGTETVEGDYDPNRWLRNDGDGFSELALDPILRDGHTLAGGFTDLDGDGAPDLYTVNDFGYWVPNGTGFLTDAGMTPLTEYNGLQMRINGMGLGLSDVNGDGIDDLAMSGWMDIRLLESQEGGTFADFGRAKGLRFNLAKQQIPWAVEFGDLDNDGTDELFAVTGYLADTPAMNSREQADAVFQLGSDGQYVDVAAAWGLDERHNGRGLVLADLNDDGHLDVIRPDKSGPLRVHLAPCSDRRALVVELRQPGANPFAVGARVRVLGPEGQGRWIRAGGTSHGSGGPPVAHFGLGLRQVVDIEIRWPDGQIDRVDGVTTNQRVRITRNPLQPLGMVRP